MHLNLALANVTIVGLIWFYCCIIQVTGMRVEGEKRTKDEFISGHAYQRQANWSYCNRQPIHFEPAQIKDNDVVFINTDMFESAMLLLRKNRMDLDAIHAGKFVAIFANSDVTFSQDNYEAIISYVIAIYAVNSACSKEDCPLLTPIPIGFVDYPDMGYSHLFMKVISTEEYGKKRNLLYLNYRIATNIEERMACTNSFLKNPTTYSALSNRTNVGSNSNSNRAQFVESDFPQYVAYEEGLGRTEYFRALIRSKFVLVPRGNGLDTHRVYEAMYFNAIPVVLAGQLDHFYTPLPVLIVQSWSELTEQFLRANYVKIRTRLINWKRTNSHWKRVDHWMPDLKKYKRKRKKRLRRDAISTGTPGIGTKSSGIGSTSTSRGGDDDDE